MEIVCDEGKCTGCMLCTSICPQRAIQIIDAKKEYNAQINESICTKCGICHSVCPNNAPLHFNQPKEWYQGWAVDETIRLESSSGGIATELIRSFLNRGGVVSSCSFSKGKFEFKITDRVEDFKSFSGSKYVKSRITEKIYKEIKNSLINGREVLFIALPCQVAGLKKYVGIKLSHNLYTVDLICHGTPSPQILDGFLSQYNININNIGKIDFRIKSKFQITNNGKSIITSGVSDRYSVAFLNGLIYTENCYECPYAQKNRISDLTIGDSWGSALPLNEQKRGISLILCQTEKGKNLLEQSNVILKEVDIKNAIENNQQLREPSFKPKKRERFFDFFLTKNIKFNNAVSICLPYQCLRQDVKNILIKMKLKK